MTAGMVLALLGEATGRRGTAVTSGTAWVLAMVVGDGPMTALGVTDPRTWSRAEWATDVVPHLAYAAAAAATLRRLEQD